MLNPSQKHSNLSDEEYERYSRHIIMEEIGPLGQERIKLARIICIGAGGLNSAALLYLASCGVGNIGIVDNDIVDKSNLQRQILYKTSSINHTKVEEAKKVLTAINPFIKIQTYNINLNKNNVDRILYLYDIVIDGTDNLTSKMIISIYCKKNHKIHIYGAIEKYIGHVSVFNYQNNFSYHEIYSNRTFTTPRTCPNTGVLNTLAGIVGTIQATEAIKIITGLGYVLNGYLLKINLLQMSFKKSFIKPRKRKKPNFQTNKEKQQLTTRRYINIEEIERLNINTYILIDVRDPIEFQIEQIPHAVNIPIKKLREMKQIKFVKRLSISKSVIIYCNSELRSFIGSQILTKYQIKHLLLKPEHI
uniref:Molybdopterin biosynthesis protein n=1 Tax=Neogoniolithon spectabile TaxID=231755 RepID=A0A3G3MGP8_9FLOR|nr:molybdopterin biosynthesis protein [Neogoniolithon spectabile]AYR05993.1 molybdopterin biosynthesis protein [Neogoniolithon spectabile]